MCAIQTLKSQKALAELKINQTEAANKEMEAEYAKFDLTFEPVDYTEDGDSVRSIKVRMLFSSNCDSDTFLLPKWILVYSQYFIFINVCFS